jgi:hypothetical protein
MKYITIIACILIAVSVSAQDCTIKYFQKSKTISTQICFNNNRDGKAIAYNSKGKVIYTKHLRKFAGHASVHFTYYPNGAVQKAEYSDAPDGGIQWHREFTSFSVDGTIIDVSSQGHDDMLTTLRHPTEKSPTQLKDVQVIQQPSIANECAPLFSNELWITNTQAFTISVKLFSHQKGFGNMQVKIPPGKTKKICVYGNGREADSPFDYYHIVVTTKTKLFTPIRQSTKNVDKHTSRYTIDY